MRVVNINQYAIILSHLEKRMEKLGRTNISLTMLNESIQLNTSMVRKGTIGKHIQLLIDLGYLERDENAFQVWHLTEEGKELAQKGVR